MNGLFGNDLHHGVAENRSFQLIALLEHLAHGAGFAVLRRALHHGVFQIGVKGLPQTVEGSDAPLGERIAHLAVDHFHALFQRSVRGMFRRSDGPFQIIQNR